MRNSTHSTHQSQKRQTHHFATRQPSSPPGFPESPSSNQTSQKTGKCIINPQGPYGNAPTNPQSGYHARHVISTPNVQQLGARHKNKRQNNTRPYCRHGFRDLPAWTSHVMRYPTTSLWNSSSLTSASLRPYRRHSSQRIWRSGAGDEVRRHCDIATADTAVFARWEINHFRRSCACMRTWVSRPDPAGGGMRGNGAVVGRDEDGVAHVRIAVLRRRDEVRESCLPVF